jgi:tRNA(Ile)-lysidine synthase
MPLADLLPRFRADLERLAGPPSTLGVAVSGGADSLALLLLAHTAYPGRVRAATVDHKLRPESAGEAAHVARICAAIGCPHDVLAADVLRGGDGLQGEARRARYAALREWARAHGIGLLLTAHHADDQAETIMLRLRRGSGLAGLAGIRAVRPEGEGLTLVRPLLGWRRGELAVLVAEAGVEAVDDPSNADPRFDRAAMRRFLADAPGLAPSRLARSASALGEAEEALAWTADRLAEERCTAGEGAWTIDPAGLPRELRRRLLARTVAAIRARHGLTGGRSEDVEGLLAALEQGATATLAGVMARGGTLWRLEVAPPRKSGA